MNKKMHRERVAAAWATVCLFFTALLIKVPRIPIKYMGECLRLCAFGILPTLFPFLVISELLIKSGGGEWLGARLTSPTRRIFGLPGECGTVILLGALCGAPIGATAAVSLYDRGVIDKRDAERLLPLCTYPSAAFTVGSIGGSMFGSTSIGLFIHISVLTAGAIIGIGAAVRKRMISRRSASSPKVGVFPHSESQDLRNDKKSARQAGGCGMDIIPAAIGSAAESSMRICAVILFFSCILGCVDNILSSLDISPIAAAAVFSFFELTFGASACTEFCNLHTGAVLTAAASAWMGLSIHLQVSAIVSSARLPRPRLYRYLAAKAIGAPLAAAFMHILCKIPAVSDSLEASVTFGTATSYFLTLATYKSPAIGACFTAAVILIFAARHTVRRGAG